MTATDPLQSSDTSWTEGPLTEAKQSPASAGMRRRFAGGPRRQSGTQPCRHGDRVASCAIVVQRKIEHPVRFEIPPPTREAVEAGSRYAALESEEFLIQSRLHGSAEIGTRQYARLLHGRISEIGSHTTVYGTYSMQRAKASLISSAPRPSAHCRSDSGIRSPGRTVRYLGIEVDDARELAEQIDVLVVEEHTDRVGARLAAGAGRPAAVLHQGPLSASAAGGIEPAAENLMKALRDRLARNPRATATA